MDWKQLFAYIMGAVDQELLRRNEYLVETDFFTAEIWTTAGLVTYYVVFLTDMASRKVHVARMTPHRLV